MMSVPSLELAKLTLIHAEKNRVSPPPKDAIVLFNPGEFSISQTGWKTDAKVGLVPANDPRTLSVTLFFDTSLPQPGGGGLAPAIATATLGRLPGLPRLHQPEDVRKYTQPVVRFTEPQIDWSNGQGKRPPLCRLQWGKSGGQLPKEGFFQGVLKSVNQTFSRFLPDGTPIRATLACEFEEWEDPDHRGKKANVIDDPIRVVRRGETLASIAQEEYGDPALWRLIAEENQLTNPRHLHPGQILTVPPRRLG